METPLRYISILQRQYSHLVRSYSAVIAEELFYLFVVMLSSPEQGTPIEGGDDTSHSGTVDDVFERFKSYLEEKIETL